MMKNNIVLIGLMGSGKTTLGRAVSKACHFRFIDTDAEVENQFGMPIPHIFEQYGESYFRELESAAVKSAAEQKNAVIATGGGVVTIEHNMACLRKTGMVFYLRCDPEILHQRTGLDNNRPLLAGAANDSGPDSRLLRLQTLLAAREPLYLRHSDVLLDTGQNTIDSLAETIIQKYKAAIIED